MCQLLGLSSNKKVDIQFSLLEFRYRGKQNYHGWGFVFHKNEDWTVIKEPYPLFKENVKADQFQFRSKIIIGHVRLASCGNQIHKNTHPFKINRWVFAHNGTVSRIMKEPGFRLGAYRPEGQTDSEYAFCYLLEKIGNEPANIKEILQTETKRIKKYGNFNFLLSDGETLFAHGDNSLYFVQRKAPFGTVTLKDEKYLVDLNEIKSPDEKVILIATEPLTENEDWQQIVGVKIFKDGKEGNEL